MSFGDSNGGGDAPRRVNPTGDGRGGSLSTVSIWSEKINGKGEDGPPLILLSDDYSFGVIAVSDGLGGAGSRQVYLDDELASGARLAATKLLEVILAFFKGAWLQEDPYEAGVQSASREDMGGPSLSKVSADKRKRRLPGPKNHQATEQLKPYLPAAVGNCSAYLLSGAVCQPRMAQYLELLSKRIDDAFEKMNRAVTEGQSASRLKTKMQRNLPSTLAGWVYRTAPEREITAFWAGDSRCYVLRHDGLRQISRDEAKGDFDAFEAIRADPPLTNYISERTPNSINCRHLLCDYQAVLICATDGAFNYQPTPMDFEFVILSSLMSSESMQAWAEELAERLQASAGDDISMVVHPLGFDNYEDLKAFYKRRLDELNAQFIDPLENLQDKQAQLEEELASVRAAAKEKTQQVWGQYRVTYEQYLHEGDSG